MSVSFSVHFLLPLIFILCNAMGSSKEGITLLSFLSYCVLGGLPLAADLSRSAVAAAAPPPFLLFSLLQSSDNFPLVLV